jgi:hypothetical protein
MSRGVHPCFHDFFHGSVPVGDVFTDLAPVKPTTFHTLRGLRTVRTVMGHFTHFGLILGMLDGSLGEFRLESEGFEAVLAAFLVDKAKHANIRVLDGGGAGSEESEDKEAHDGGGRD